MEHELQYASVHEYARTKALGEAAVLKVWWKWARVTGLIRGATGAI